MSHYYLAPYTGAGTEADPYRPAVEQPRWSAIDRRPDSTRREGYALVALPEPERGLIHLGDGAPARSHARTLSRAFGYLPLRGRRFGDAVASLMFSPRVARWCGAMTPTAAGRYEIHLGGLVWTMPVLAGGITETWFHADSPGAISADNTWTILGGNAGIVSNRARCVQGDTFVYARCDVDLATANHSAESQVLASGALDGISGVIMRRDATGTDQYYWCRVRYSPATPVVDQVKVPGFTQIGSDTAISVTSLDTLYTIKGQIDGTTLKTFWEGSEVQSNTDTSIPAVAVRCGIRGNAPSFSGNFLEWENWTAVDVGGAEPPQGGAYHQTIVRVRGFGRWV